MKIYDAQQVLRLGQRIRLTGHGMAGNGFLDQALIANDGLHSATEKRASIFLEAGKHFIRAEWFNGTGPFLCNLEYAGPGMTRQRIPNGALFQVRQTNAAVNDNGASGLNYRCYEGDFKSLPHWQELEPFKTGVVPNFDLDVRTRDAGVALEFYGYLNVDRSGVYTFWEESDDGSRLFVDDSQLHINVLGPMALPVPKHIQLGSSWNLVGGFEVKRAAGRLWSLKLAPCGGRTLLVIL